MEMLHFKAIKLVIVSTLMFSYSSCRADTNLNRGLECSEADNSTTENSFQTNLNNLLNTLATQGPLHNGFYKTTSGRNSNKIYSLIQCRGDILAQDCANCTKESITVASRNCSKSKRVAIWFRWCFLRYSDENFFGVWDPSSVAMTNKTGVDDPDVVSKGLALMSGLVSTVPSQPLMFQTAIVDVGQSGKRYGMAQCTRDISRTNCGKCLDGKLVFFKETIDNKRGLEIYGKSCSMWYNDFQFYFNISSTTASDGGRRPSSHGGVMVGIITSGALLLVL